MTQTLHVLFTRDRSPRHFQLLMKFLLETNVGTSVRYHD